MWMKFQWGVGRDVRPRGPRTRVGRGRGRWVRRCFLSSTSCFCQTSPFTYVTAVKQLRDVNVYRYCSCGLWHWTKIYVRGAGRELAAAPWSAMRSWPNWEKARMGWCINVETATPAPSSPSRSFLRTTTTRSSGRSRCGRYACSRWFPSRSVSPSCCLGPYNLPLWDTSFSGFQQSFVMFLRVCWLRNVTSKYIKAWDQIFVLVLYVSRAGDGLRAKAIVSLTFSLNSYIICLSLIISVA